MVCSIFPPLIGCFVIILSGYISSRCNLITQTQGRGIGLYICYIALPALIFKAIVAVDFGIIDWQLWCGLLLSKSILFIGVAVLALLLCKENRFGKAGLYAIFVTQSNDFALGLPLFGAIFDLPSNKYLINYVYLLAPINLAFLNPIAFSLLEYQKVKNYHRDFVSTEDENGLRDNNYAKTDDLKIQARQSMLWKLIFRTLKGTILNPHIFMIVLGIIGNYTFGQHIPELFESLFFILSNSFGATALFYLGVSLGGSSSNLKGIGLVLPVLFVALKGILLPIIMRQIVVDLTSTSTSSNFTGASNHTEGATTFAFLYGTIPTAPTVIIYAAKYGIGEDVIASGLLIGTILSAPIFYSSVKMLEVRNMQDIDMFRKIISEAFRDVSCISLVLCVWVIVVFACLRIHKRMIHRFTLVLIVFQILLCVMGATFHIYSNSNHVNLVKACIWSHLFAIHGSFSMTAIISVTLVFSTCGRSQVLERWWYFFMLVGIALPSAVATASYLTMTNVVRKAEESFYFSLAHCFHEKISGILSIFSGTTYLMVVVLSLIKLRKSEHSVGCYKSCGLSGNSKETRPLLEPSTAKNCDTCDTPSILTCSGNSYVGVSGDIESLDSDLCVVKRTHVALDSPSNDKNVEFLNNVSIVEKIEIEWLRLKDKNHLTQHVILILILSFIMVLNITLIIWQFVSKYQNEGIFLELEMLSIVLTYGQGFFSFIIFGFLKELYALPVFEWLFMFFSRHGSKKVTLPSVADLDKNILRLCERFKNNDLEKCKKDISCNLRCRFTTYEEVFKGSSLVTWLLESGLVNDRFDGVRYGNRLLKGKIIEHYVNQYYFHDLPYIYRFTCDALQKGGKKKKRFTK